MESQKVADGCNDAAIACNDLHRRLLESPSILLCKELHANRISLVTCKQNFSFYLRTEFAVKYELYFSFYMWIEFLILSANRIFPIIYKQNFSFYIRTEFFLLFTNIISPFATNGTSPILSFVFHVFNRCIWLTLLSYTIILNNRERPQTHKHYCIHVHAFIRWHTSTEIDTREVASSNTDTHKQSNWKTFKKNYVLINVLNTSSMEKNTKQT